MILHGLFLCITSFAVGVILTWLFFSWKMDRQESGLFRRIKNLEIDNRAIKIAIDKKTDLLEKTIKIMEDPIWERDNEIWRLDNTLCKQQQEKEQCPE